MGSLHGEEYAAVRKIRKGGEGGIGKNQGKDMQYDKVKEGDSTFLVTATTAMQRSEDYPLGLG